MKAMAVCFVLAALLVGCSGGSGKASTDPVVGTMEAETNYMNETTKFAKSNTTALQAITTLMNMATTNPVLRSDAAWKEQVNGPLQDLKSGAAAFKAVPPAPEKFAKSDAWARKAADETLAYVDNMNEAINNMDDSSLAAAYVNMQNISTYFQEEGYEFNKAIGK